MNIKNKIKSAFLDLKLELLSLCVLVLYITLTRLKRICVDTQILQNYFTEQRMSVLVTFVSISIGVYMAVLSIFATAVTIASEKIVDKGLDTGFVRVVSVGLIENVAVAILIMIVPMQVPFYIELLTVFLLLALNSFQKFIRIVIALFKINIDNVKDTIKKQDNLKEDVLNLLEQINRNTKNKQ